MLTKDATANYLTYTVMLLTGKFSLVSITLENKQ